MRTGTSWLFIAGLFLSACTAAGSAVIPTIAPRPALPSVPASTPVVASTQTSAPNTAPQLLPQESPPAGAFEFKTDFSKHTVPYQEILPGGPPKDGIPAIDRPRFVSVTDADAWLKPVEPVILLQIGEDVRAYPLQILIWHEIVTFCPLCNTAIVFECTVDGKVLDFGTTGRLRYSNLVMYDRQTETWWQQAEGRAIAGELTGAQLEFRPASIIGWLEFKTAYPQGQVLSRDTGYTRSYGRNPYAGYDDVNNPPFLYRGPATPGVLPPVARVLAVDLNGQAVAYPYDVLQKAQVVNDAIGGTNIVVLWEPGTASALDAGTVADGRDVGAANAYERNLEGQSLTFAVDGSRIIDKETGSEWNVLGQAISGKLTGKQLKPVVSVNHFWFSWAAFKPETKVYQP